MATFTYQYRDSSGSLKSGTVEAENRSKAFEVLKARGVTPLSVVLGKPTTLVSKSRGSFWWVFVAISIVACVVIGVFVFLRQGPVRQEVAHAHDRKSKERIDHPARKPSVERPQPPKVTRASSKPVASAEPEKVAPIVSNVVETTSDSAPTNKIFRAPSLSRRTVTLMDGTTGELTSRRIFGQDKPLDLQIMAVTKPGGMASGLRSLLLRYSDDEIVAMLKQPVAYDTSDPEDVRLIKMRVQAQKNIVLDFLRQGGTVTDAINQMCQSAGKERIEMRNDQIALNMLMKSGDSEAVHRFLEERNESRREAGLPELSLPSALQPQQEEQSK